MSKAEMLIPSIKKIALTSLSLYLSTIAYADVQQGYFQDLKHNFGSIIKPKADESFQKVQLAQMAQFSYAPFETNSAPIKHLELQEAISIVLKRNPEISRKIADLSSQNAQIDVAKSQYFPQLSAGINTGDFTSNDKGRQVYSIEANQLLYDFGKVKSTVTTQQKKLEMEQANVLITIDEISRQAAQSVIGILRYRDLVKIANAQIKGVSRLYDIAKLRADSGISSQADPVQAQSYVSYAKAYMLTQQNKLAQEEQKLSTLLGFDVSNTAFVIPPQFLQNSELFNDPPLESIPSLILANAEIEVAKSQLKQTSLSRYPTVSLTGSLNQAFNGKNPNTGKKNDTDSSIGISVRSNFYQGGAVSSQIRSASFAEQSAKARMNSSYLDIQNAVRTSRRNIESLEQQIWILMDRERSTAKTRELYEEQYKLGKRSILDLLSSEQSLHSSRAERESARYDIYETLASYVSTVGKGRDVYQLNNMNIQGFEILP